MNTRLTTYLGAILLTLVTAVSFAHTVATTAPKTGASLAQSPPVIEITFAHEASLTSVAVIAAGTPERKLEFAPKGSAKVFTIANANLAAGRSEIQWKALSKDGHVISGSIVLTIDPALAKTPNPKTSVPTTH
jgi:methionine-rich copper-binding protein CopC